MSNNSRSDWHERLKAVEAEHAVAGLAVAAYRREFVAGRVRLPDPLDGRDLSATADHLPDTYLVRLFAAFEASLRSYWATLGRDTQPPATDLMNGVAARRQVPDPTLAAAHTVREYRNGLVHGSETASAPQPVGGACRRLQRFLAHLPDDW